MANHTLSLSADYEQALNYKLDESNQPHDDAHITSLFMMFLEEYVELIKSNSDQAKLVAFNSASDDTMKKDIIKSITSVVAK
jgi:hypothetical protein